MSAAWQSRGRNLMALAAATLVTWTTVPLYGQSGPTHERGTLGAEVRTAALERVKLGHSYVDAADFLVREASVQRMGDREQARVLQLAGRLYHHAGRLADARWSLNRAGRLAYRAGEPAFAVNLYLEAAQAAWEDGNKRGAWHAAERAGYVLQEAQLPPAVREEILSRISYADWPELRLEPQLARQ